MEGEALAERDDHGLAAIRHEMARHHLWLDLKAAVDAVERVPDQEAMVAVDQPGRDHRVEDRRIRLRHEAQRARGLRARDARRKERRTEGGAKTDAQGVTKQVSTAHAEHSSVAGRAACDEWGMCLRRTSGR